jgi:hypothetical protein
MRFYGIFMNDLGIHNFQGNETTKSPKDININEHANSHQPILNIGLQ